MENKNGPQIKKTSGIAQLSIGLLLIYLNIQRGGGFTSDNSMEASGYNMTSLIIWIISIILVYIGLRRIIKNTKKQRKEENTKSLKSKDGKGFIYKHFTLDNTMKLSIIAGILMVALAITYYLIIFLPKRNTERKRENATETCLKQKEESSKAYTSAINSCTTDVCQETMWKNYSKYVPKDYMEKCIERVITIGY